MKTRKPFYLSLFLLLLLGCTWVNSSFAMLVEDPTEWLKTMKVIEEAEQQYDQLKRNYMVLNHQYQTMKNQYQTMQQQYSAMTGNYGWGNWQNSLSQLNHQREWAPNDWQSALKGLSGGNPARYQQLLSEYKQNHPSLSQSAYAKGADSHLAQSYQNQVRTNETSGTQASYEFDDINRHLKTLYQLGQSIENHGKNNTMKAAVDLNSRVELEVGYIAVEELRMQTLLNQQTAQLQAAHLSQSNEAAEFNQAGEKK
jgi:type IV secretion system protein VirB5